MAKKTTTTKSATKTTPKKTAPETPTEFTLGGESYRITPRTEWSVEQDDQAMSIMMDVSFDLSEMDTNDNDSSGRAIMRELTRTGRYREMLGVTLSQIDPEGEPRSIRENIAHFRKLRLDLQAAMPAVTASIAAFFGSGES